MSNIKVNHIGIAVEDIDKAIAIYADAIGLPLDCVSEDPVEHVRLAFLPTASGDIELIQPTAQNSGINKFLKKRGEGLHHICFEVANIEETLTKMRAQGLEVIGEPRFNYRGKKYVFIHPKSANGVLLELYEIPPKNGEDA